MNATFREGLAPATRRFAVYACLSALLIGVISCHIVIGRLPAGEKSSVLGTCIAGLALTIHLQLRGLARARRLFGRMPLPLALAQRWHKAALAEISVQTVLYATAAAISLNDQGVALPWLSGAAAISTSAALATLAAMATLSLPRPRAGQWALAVLTYAVIAAMVAERPWLQQQLAGASAAILVVLLLAWPATALWALSGWRPPIDLPVRAPRARWRTRLLASLRALTPLAPRRQPRQGAQPQTVRMLLTQLWATCMPTFFFLQMRPLMWGEAPGLGQLLSFATLCFGMTVSLVARDLHWRLVLSPGFGQRRQIAWRVFAATAQVQLCALAAIGAGVIAIDWSSASAPDTGLVTQHFTRYALVPLEVLFAICAALVLRLLPFARLGAVILAGMCWASYFVISLATLHDSAASLALLPPAGWQYAAILAGGGAVLFALAGRKWTAPALLACANETPGRFELRL